jgi:hypothetical protein
MRAIRDPRGDCLAFPPVPVASRPLRETRGPIDQPSRMSDVTHEAAAQLIPPLPQWPSLAFQIVIRLGDASPQGDYAQRS